VQVENYGSGFKPGGELESAFHGRVHDARQADSSERLRVPFHVDKVVLYHQGMRGIPAFRKRRFLRVRGFGEWDEHGKTAAFSLFALHRHAAAMEFRHPAHERKPQARPGVLSRQARIDLHERLEKLAQVVALDADAPVPDGKARGMTGIVHRYVETYLAALGSELDCVA